MLLNDLQNWVSYSTKKSKRIGRWNWSWKGNYSTRGHKWQKARSGYSKRPWFEWGQTSLNMRLPKLRWFKRYYKLVDNYEVLNVSVFEKSPLVNDWDTINKEKLNLLWLISSENSLVKVLWSWEINKKLNFSWIDSFSASAKTKVEKAGWKIS